MEKPQKYTNFLAKKSLFLFIFLLALAPISFLNAKDISIGTTAADKVGIGTASPAAKLQINPASSMQGLIIKSSDQSPFIIKSSSDSEIFKVDQNGNITSTGSFVGSNNYWNLSGSNLYASTTSWNLGIGTNNARAKLDITGAVDVGGSSELAAAVLGSSYNHWTYFGGTTAGRIRGNSGEGYLIIEAFPTGTQNDLIFRTAGNERLRILSTGNIGIGTSNPGSDKLVVNGGRITTLNGYNMFSAGQIHAAGTGRNFLYGKLGVSLPGSGGVTNLAVSGNASIGASYTNSANVPSPPTDGLIVVGNVGIGTANPGSYKLNVVGNTYINGTLTAKSITNVKRAINSVSSNIGTPTVEEMALFHGQFNNKFRFIPPILQEESANGSTWTTSARATDNQLKDLMIGEGQGTSFNAIPSLSVGGSGYYRLTWDTSMTGYVYLNSLYIYNSTSGNQVNFKIDAYHNVNGWTEITNGTISNWPGHTYIPHSALPFHPTGTSHYSKVRVTFSITSATNTNPFALYAIEWFGGYPAATRNVQSYDRDKNVTFPAAIRGGGGTSGIPIFSFASDPDSGMYRGGDNIIRFSTGGSDRMTIYNNGNVGIGTTVPDAKLDVSGSINLSSSGKLAFGGVNTNWIDFTSNYFRLLMAGSSAAPIKVGGLVISGDYSPTAPSGGAYIQGNVGIGTSVPLDKLHVNGNVRVGGLLNCSGTGAAVKTDASGRLVCGTISGGVTGSVSGTTNYLAKWTGTNTLGNTVIYDNGTNVGIGTTTPAAKLQINPQTGVEGLRIISSNYSPLVIRDSTNSNDYLRVYQWGLVNTPRGLTSNYISVYPGYSNSSWNYDSLYIGNHGWYSGDELGIVEQYNGYNLITHDYGAGSSGKLFVGNSITEDRGTGNVGIGTTNPRNNLEVGISGDSSMRLGGIFSGSTGSYTAIGQETSRHQLIFSSYRDSFPDTVGAKIVAINKTAYVSPDWWRVQHTDLAFYTLGSTPSGTDSTLERFRISSNGNVGIGTTNPTVKLHVVGTGSETLMQIGNFFSMRADGVLDWGNALAQGQLSWDTGKVWIGGKSGNNLELRAGGATQMTILSGGSVGIGTNNPGGILDVSTVAGSSGGNRTITLKQSGQAALNFGSYPGAWTTALAIQNNDNSRMIWMNPMDTGSGANSRIYAYGSGLDIYTGGTSGGTLGISQSSAGNVGIGTTNPQTKLHISQPTPDTDGLIISTNTINPDNAQHYGAISFQDYGTKTGNYSQIRSWSNLYHHWGSQLSFHVTTGAGPTLIEAMRINHNGSVGIGTDNPIYKLTVGGDVGASAFNYTSDRSLKKNIKTIANPIDKIMNLRGVSFNWKDNGQASLGLIAQEVEKVFPELVTGDGLKSVQYGNLVAPLIEAVKEQQREIELLNKRIEALEARK